MRAHTTVFNPNTYEATMTECQIKSNENGDLVITFSGSALVLDPGATITFSSEDTVFLPRKRYEVLMKYYDWRTDGATVEDPPFMRYGLGIKAPRINESFPHTKRAWRRLKKNLWLLFWKTM
jgi:hypothetical protein